MQGHFIHIHKNGTARKIVLLAGILMGIGVLITGGVQLSHHIAPDQFHSTFQAITNTHKQRIQAVTSEAARQAETGVPENMAAPENSSKTAITSSVSAQPVDTPLTATAADFQQIVLEPPVPVLVMFGAEWCPVCQQAEPVLEAAARDFSEQVIIVRVDIDRTQHIVSQYNVHGTPTFLLFKAGEIVGRQNGFGGQPHLFGFIKRYL